MLQEGGAGATQEQVAGINVLAGANVSALANAAAALKDLNNSPYPPYPGAAGLTPYQQGNSLLRHCCVACISFNQFQSNFKFRLQYCD